VSRRIELWTSIQELNEQGEYSDVELLPGKDGSTGGVFQLRQVWEIHHISPLFCACLHVCMCVCVCVSAWCVCLHVYIYIT